MSADLSEVTLVPANRVQADATEFCAMVNEHVAHAFPMTPVDVLEPKSIFFWAFSGGQRIGTSGYTRRTPRLAEIRKTMVLPQYRGCGMGIHLCLQMEKQLKSDGIYKAMVTVFSTNLVMVNLRLKLGYIIEGFHRDHEAPDFHEYSLGKILLPSADLPEEMRIPLRLNARR